MEKVVLTSKQCLASILNSTKEYRVLGLELDFIFQISKMHYLLMF